MLFPDDVAFEPGNMYETRPLERTKIVTLVVAYAPVRAVAATVVNGWHGSRSDPTTHCTVDYFDGVDELPFQRTHIPKPMPNQLPGPTINPK
ncbi:hypothetical protein PG985_011377 [Apiospora marii]|uniref:Uncharacterized protein n=1 Tax=Apiospora marii TaxID=335849 RepID=A0ABR1SVB1_9PEZI